MAKSVQKLCKTLVKTLRKSCVKFLTDLLNNIFIDQKSWKNPNYKHLFHTFSALFSTTFSANYSLLLQNFYTLSTEPITIITNKLERNI